MHSVGAQHDMDRVLVGPGVIPQILIACPKQHGANPEGRFKAPIPPDNSLMTPIEDCLGRCIPEVVGLSLYEAVVNIVGVADMTSPAAVDLAQEQIKL